MARRNIRFRLDIDRELDSLGEWHVSRFNFRRAGLPRLDFTLLAGMPRVVEEGRTSLLDTPAKRSDVQLSVGSSLTIAALGVVFGDIGTSPLYAVRQSLVDFGDLSERSILGALSLIVWALTLVVTVKYVLVIMRADNHGEGGLLALTALVLRTTSQGRKRYSWIMAAGLVGAALFYGDGVITPAISVLSAIEGLNVATPLFEPYMVPISLLLLTGLFLVQRRGTAAVGGLFGPVML